MLVASSRFDDAEFAPLRFPVRDAERLRALLLNPDLCGFDEAVLLPNLPSAAVRRALEKQARASEPDDLLLFYYSGHGRLDRDGTLALAMSDSDPDMLTTTSLVSDELKRLFDISRASQKVMILDCCYSGSVGSHGFKGALGDSIEALAQQASGSFVLTASRRFERAWELEKEEAGALTETLVEGVETGAASTSAADHITLAELAVYARRRVPAGAAQQPQYWDQGGIGGLAFSKKPARFDAAWARKARALVTRYVRYSILDDDLADELRRTIQKREDDRQRDRLRLIDRLVRKDIQVSAFVREWSDLDRLTAHQPPMASAPPPPPPPEPRSEDSDQRERPAPAAPPARADESRLTLFGLFMFLILLVLVIYWMKEAQILGGSESSDAYERNTVSDNAPLPADKTVDHVADEGSNAADPIEPGMEAAENATY